MKITKTCCQGCGATLDVSAGLRYVTCNHCGSHLEVLHDHSTTHTRLVERLESSTARLEEQVRTLQRQNDLNQLDREWDEYYKSRLIRGRYGEYREPSLIGACATGIVAGGMGLFLLTRISSFGGFSPIPPLFGLVLLILGGWQLIAGVARANEFSRARDNYYRRRHELTGHPERNEW